MKEFKEKFQVEELLIFKVGNWNISLRPVQVTLGSLVLSLNRKCPELSDLTSEETGDLSEVFKKIEEILKKSFQPDKLNYLALMMQDHQVHFHILPRYKNEIEFNSKTYSDSDWPKPADIFNTLEFSREELNLLKNKLIEQL